MSYYVAVLVWGDSPAQGPMSGVCVIACGRIGRYCWRPLFDHGKGVGVNFSECR